MKTFRSICNLVVALAALAAASAQAQTTAASGTVMVLPQIADIPGAYVTTVFVQNPHASAITLDVTYYFSDQADAASPGPRSPARSSRSRRTPSRPSTPTSSATWRAPTPA